MTMATMRSGSSPCSGCGTPCFAATTPLTVHLVWNRFEVFNIPTPPIVAEMVQLQPLLNRADEMLPEQLMNIPAAALELYRSVPFV